jgi:hypothetical protein
VLLVIPFLGGPARLFAAPASRAGPRDAVEGTSKVSGTVVSYDAATGVLRLKDRLGQVSEFLVDARTAVLREGKPAPASFSSGERVRLLRFERRSRRALRIDLRRR